MSNLRGRVEALERQADDGRCPVCRDRPELERVGTGSDCTGQPCPACGRRPQVIRLDFDPLGTDKQTTIR